MTPSWIAGADADGFGVDNLPLGIYSLDDAPRAGVAIGTHIADLSMLVRERLVDDETLLDARTLNAFLAHGPGAWRSLRTTLQRLFGNDASAHERDIVQRTLSPRGAATMHMPIAVQDYVDFFSSIEHASNLGKILRPGGEALTPNYRHMPIGYHGRSSTIVIDGTNIRRPAGQTKTADATLPSFGPTRMLDFELEMGFVTGPGNVHGEPIAVDAVRDHVYGCVLLNDWSARDIQGWEYQPLGPFLAKSFATSISPWLVSLEALEPFCVANRAQDPEPLPYLRVSENHAYDIGLEVYLASADMRSRKIAPVRISRTTFAHMYWNIAQQLAHMTVNGARIRAGDLLGSGTVSGTAAETYGSMIELTWRGTRPIALPTGETRGFLEDGDTVIMRGLAQKDARRISLGEVRGTIVA